MSAVMSNTGKAPQMAADDGLQVVQPLSAEHEKMPASDHQSPVSHYAHIPAASMSVHAPTQGGTVSPPPPPPLDSYPKSHAQERPPDEQRRKSVPWGLNPWLFAAMAALIGMLISGAIFGGVMGSMLANNSQSSNSSGSTALSPAAGPPGPVSTTSSSQPQPPPATGSSTSSSTATAASSPYRATPPREVERLPLDCPRLDKATVGAFGDARFSLECGRDSRGVGREAAGELSVIVAHWAYSLDDCLGSCASMNARSAAASRGLRCRLVVFQARMRALAANGGNCFLKNATRAVGNNGIANGNAITASLVMS